MIRENIDPIRLTFAIAMTVTFCLCLDSSLFHYVAFGQPIVRISPSCGPKSGFNVDITAKGFTPNINVNWKLVGSDNDSPLSGYFHVDNTGAISDSTFADDIKPDNYKMYFAEDANNDGNFDEFSSNYSNAEIEIPCGK